MADAMWTLKWGRMIGALALAEGAQLPRGYGIAWALPFSHRYYCLPVPFNRIIGAFRAWYLDWRRPVEDDPIETAFQYGRSTGFQDGINYGERRTLDRIAIIEKTIAEINRSGGMVR